MQKNPWGFGTQYSWHVGSGLEGLKQQDENRLVFPYPCPWVISTVYISSDLDPSSVTCQLGGRQLVVIPGPSSSSLPHKLSLKVSGLGNAKLMRVKGMHDKAARISPELKRAE